MTRVVGIAGPPGSGKSTLAARLADASPGLAVVVPMDGFHLGNAVLAERGIAGRKGAPDTFDVDGLVSLLRAIRAPGRGVLSAPAYSRERHEPVADAIPIPARVDTVIVEGNYLGLAYDGWEQIRPLLDVLWLLDVPWAVTRERLVARRVSTGREPGEAAAWVDSVDRVNDRIVRSTLGAADGVLRDGELPPVH